MAILECRDLTKRYGKKAALEGVNLTVEPGRVVGLLGPNGSGKTTLIKLANGLLTPTGGRVLVDGQTNDPAHGLSARTKGGRLVHLAGDPALVGRFARAEITGSSTWALFGKAAED